MPVSIQIAESRLAAIEVLLLWEGRVGNARLREFFPVHSSQASRDLAAYRLRAPDNIELRAGSKEFFATPYARAVLTAGHFDEYAALMGAPAPRQLKARIDTEVELVTVSQPAPHVFREIHEAIATRGGVEIEYASMNHPEAHRRMLFPHAIVFASPRWHIRAWCSERQDFRDFNLGRIQTASATALRAPKAASDDQLWNQSVRVHLIPHEGLNAAQRRVVRQEYMGGAAALVQTRRAALVPYLLQAYRVAVDIQREIPPEYLLQLSESNKLPKEALWRNGTS